MYDVQKCAAVPKNRCEKCIGPVMHEQMPAYTVYIGKTGAFYRKRGNRITGSLPDGADDRENPV